MLIIFHSSFTNTSESLELLKAKLESNKVDFKVINPLNIAFDAIKVIEDEKGLRLEIDDQEVQPTSFIFLNNWRTDSIVKVPSSTKYPNAFRMRAGHFLQDMQFAFESKTWLPGSIEAINRSDSKLRLFHEARKEGLVVPEFTTNTSGNSLPDLKKSVFRKNLGPAFTISLNNQTGKEAGVTTVGTFHETPLTDGNLWQWQKPIHTTIHVRCFVCGDEIWSSFWTRDQGDQFADYRFFGQVSGKEIKWIEHSIPTSVADSVKKLTRKMGLRYASPEFLINLNGEYVFIDLNPCGDWYGFFSDKSNCEIVDSICKAIDEVS